MAREHHGGPRPLTMVLIDGEVIGAALLACCTAACYARLLSGPCEVRPPCHPPACAAPPRLRVARAIQLTDRERTRLVCMASTCRARWN